MATYEKLEELLAGASRLLDQAAEQVRDLGLHPDRNIRKIGEAIVLTSEIRKEVYDQRPDLMPDYLKE
jgi:DNA-binding ferritin-like protein